MTGASYAFLGIRQTSLWSTSDINVACLPPTLKPARCLARRLGRWTPATPIATRAYERASTRSAAQQTRRAATSTRASSTPVPSHPAMNARLWRLTNGDEERGLVRPVPDLLRQRITEQQLHGTGARAETRVRHIAPGDGAEEVRIHEWMLAPSRHPRTPPRSTRGGPDAHVSATTRESRSCPTTAVGASRERALWRVTRPRRA